MTRTIASLLIVLSLLTAVALAQTVTVNEAARQVQMAVHPANLAQEAIKGQMDGELRRCTSAIEALSAPAAKACVDADCHFGWEPGKRRMCFWDYLEAFSERTNPPPVPLYCLGRVPRPPRVAYPES